MGSDRARISSNPSQLYRSVVMQQGRVTLEADWNEAQILASEQTRREALDFVGPAGTWKSDNGYAIALIPSTSDFSIGSGSMYVGGVRAWLPAGVNYSAQPQGDWMDFAQDPDWTPLSTASPAFNEYIYLLLREQEISAVEDSDLKDIALGGPDTAQRTRLIQHVVRHRTTGTDCPSALTDVQANWWNPNGYQLDPTAMRVSSFARLQVGFVNTVTPPSPCDPVAQGGYLGADNQLIRVQVSGAKSSGLNLVWGYDDASFLYEVTLISPGSATTPTTLSLNSAPVDAGHIPQSGQAVELLLPGAKLANGQYAAASTGQIFILGASAYTPGANTLTLPPGLNTSLFASSPAPAQLYLRIWQGQSTFVPGQAQPLINAVTGAATGLTVTLTTAASGQSFRIGDFWMFSVRPPSPDLIYPERYTSSPQPPDGPREWICPLALVQWTQSPVLVTACTNTFLNLVELSNLNQDGCCSVYVTAQEHNLGTFTIQQGINQVLSTGGRVCLGPGTFNLTSTLQINGVTLPIEINGMGTAAFLATAAAGSTTLKMAQPASPQKLSVPAILIENCQGVTIQDLELVFAPGDVVAAGSGAGAAAIAIPNPGIMIQNSDSVTVQRCTLTCIGNTLPSNPAIAIGGLVYQTSILDNIIQFVLSSNASTPALGAGFGITNLPVLSTKVAAGTLTCYTYDLFISGNILQGVTFGVEFDATCYHLGQVILSANQFGPAAAAIVIAGNGLAPLFTRVEIVDNQIVASLSGIACGISARIANNDMTLLPLSTPSAADSLIGGIVMTAPVLAGSTIDGLQIVGNRISGGSGFGILIEAQIVSGRIAGNVLEATACGGIYATAGFSHLSITGNQLLNLVPNSSDPGVGELAGAYGILLGPAINSGAVVQAGYVEILGNVIKNLATDEGQATVGSASRYAIALQGHTSAVIANNQLINIGPAGHSIDQSAGIFAAAYPFDRIDITGNVIRRSDSTTIGDVGTQWYGVDISGFKYKKLIFDGAGEAVQVLNQKLISTDKEGIIGIGQYNSSLINAGGLQHVSLGGNYIETAGSASAVSIDVEGNCIFTGNQCSLATSAQDESVAVVTLEATGVVASNNVLLGANSKSAGLAITTSSTANKSNFTILGNVVTGTIRANAAALSATLEALNVTT